MQGVRSVTSSSLGTRAAATAGVVLGSVLMAAGAHVSIPVPFSPVPITGQTFALALVVALLGTRGATAAMVVYFGEGLTGWPVFSPHGVLGPTLGYIVAFPFAAFVTGWLFDRGLARNVGLRFVAIALGTLVVFAGGASWLSFFVGWPAAFALGVVPFLIGDVVKTAIAAVVAPAVRSLGASIPKI